MSDAAPTPYVFEFSADVRDYECDMQGIVNNAVYLNYFEHARHALIRQHGIAFGDLIKQDIQTVMGELTIRYLKSLVSGDRFTVRLLVSRANGLIVFKGDIYRAHDDALCAKAIAKIAVLCDGRLTGGEYFDDLLAKLAR